MITFDNSGTAAAVNSTSLTASFTNAGNILFVGVRSTVNATDNISGITYGGIALTKLATIQMPSDRWISLWGIVNPPTGANNIIISSSTSDFIEPSWASYAGANGGIDASGTNNGTPLTSISKTLTTTVDKEWSVAFATGNGSETISGGAGTTLRQMDSGSINGALFDSNAAITPAGNTTLTVNASASATMAIAMATFKQTQSSGGFFLAAQ